MRVQDAFGGGEIVCSVGVLLVTAVTRCWAILAEATAAFGAAENSWQVPFKTLRIMKDPKEKMNKRGSDKTPVDRK